MLESIDLSRTVEKSEYKREKEALGLKLASLQRRILEHGIPVIVVFEGWDAAGKGTLINRLIMPLDPRGFSVHSTLAPNEEERLRPFLWRSWIKTPARGRIAVYDRSWYRRLLNDRVDGELKTEDLPSAQRDIVSFERQLADDGNIIIKLFLHISKKTQKMRFAKLRGHEATAWRVTKGDLKRHRQYDDYLEAAEAMLAATESDFAPWTLVEAEDERFATLKIFRAVAGALESQLARVTDEPKLAVSKAARSDTGNLNVSILANIDLNQTLEREDYRKRLKKKQQRLRELEHEIYVRRAPVVIVYEGWDAAGKGGNIRRLTEELDPRGYEVVPIGAPNDIEKAHHYLWRFWTQMPKAGHITIFDRSWYGRVLVERVEGFCTPEAWRRAYREINEMERHLTAFGTVLCKFWLQIDRKEQLRRFHEREAVAHKQWKITEDDWRNRKQWKAYHAAVEEMLARTSTPAAPWTVVESNCKWHARLKVLDAVITAIEAKL